MPQRDVLSVLTLSLQKTYIDETYSSAYTVVVQCFQSLNIDEAYSSSSQIIEFFKYTALS